MTTKTKWQIPQKWGLVLLLLGMAGCSASTASSPDKVSQAAGESTTFECVEQGGGWATVAKRGKDVSPSPLISWNTPEFGPEYTPEKRCQIVSTRLTNIVAKNGGWLGGLDLTAGKVENGSTVVCLVNQQPRSCNLGNMLFTLNEQNAKNPSQVLTTITRFAEGKATNSNVAESKDIPQSIPLEVLVNRSFDKR
ncbi:COP23 domain-containing protein [Microcoleus sp. A003_D6]|uniref:COP23 domain-containing protein n=1 Tax=Microcoleus sp. A003_D6 TaxID=3055266 RepID=UPI002FD18269